MNEPPQNRNKFSTASPGDWVYRAGAEGACGYLYMALCGEYVLLCPEDMIYEDCFGLQLAQMSEDCCDGLTPDIYLYPAKEIFLTAEDAEAYLEDDDSDFTAF